MVQAILAYAGSHLLSILYALIASYAIGFAWHGPVFGKLWMSYNKLTPPKKDEMKFSMMLPGLSANLALVVVMSAVLGGLFQMSGLQTLGDALTLTLLLWLPFTALVIVNGGAWEGHKPGHIALDVAHTLVQELVMGAILFATL